VSRAVLSVGSNLGDRLAFLQGCVDGLREVLAVSRVYQTAPWGPVEQDDFYNAVLLVAEDGTGPRGWLDRARALEAAAGRRREVRWGPRSLDVDVVTVDDVRSADPELTLPHPRAHERAFVLVPWLEVEPDAVLPAHGAVADLARRVDRTGVRPRPDLVLQRAPRAERAPGASTGSTGVSG
jgi:2-amino-4-hydroxy-6-hydroxymethyldihydropteridine diphosphokinase